MNSLADNLWGKDDQLGAANQLTPRLTVAALALARTGKTIDLTLPLAEDCPRGPDQSPYTLCMWSNPISSKHELANAGASNGIGFADERVELDLHTGTHIDALGHCVVGDLMYGGRSVEETVSNRGLRFLGVEHIPPIIARGILIDMPAAQGRNLEPGEEIKVRDMEKTLAKQHVELKRGDVVLIRTGWTRYFRSDNETYLSAWPGIGVDGARWLAGGGAVVVGSDTLGLELRPDVGSSVQWPVHQELLVRSGVYILEQANLEEASERGAYEFLCLCLPIPFLGATASPIRLVGVI